MAETARHRSARTCAHADQSRTRQGRPRCASPPDRRGPNGGAVQGDRCSFAGVAGTRWIRMTITYREGTVEDADAIAALFAHSFNETFGHLYGAEDLEAFLATMQPDRFRRELGDERFVFILACD